MSAVDGPAWLTFLILSHSVLRLALIFGRNELVSLWLAILTLIVVTIFGVYVALPRAKGIFFTQI